MAVPGCPWLELYTNHKGQNPVKSAKLEDAFCFYGEQQLSLLSEERDGNSTLKRKKTSRIHEST